MDLNKVIASRLIQKKYKEFKKRKIHEYVEAKLTCCICTDVYESFTRCKNGHGVCDFCFEFMNDNTCPMCRNNLCDTPESLTFKIATELNLKTPCCMCHKKFNISNIEKHRNWCNENMFICPSKDVCNKRFKMRDLYDHLKHHERNIIFLKDNVDTIATYLFSNENNILICLEKTRHIISVFWTLVRTDMGIPLIGICARCYYPSKSSKSVHLKIESHNILSGSITETFLLENLDPVLFCKENASTSPICTLTPLLRFTENKPGSIKSVENYEMVTHYFKNFKRNVELINDGAVNNFNKRRILNMLSPLKNAVSFITIKTIMSETSIENVA